MSQNRNPKTLLWSTNYELQFVHFNLNSGVKWDLRMSLITCTMSPAADPRDGEMALKICATRAFLDMANFRDYRPVSRLLRSRYVDEED